MYQAAGLGEHRPVIENSLMPDQSKHGNAYTWGTWVIVLEVVIFLLYYTMCMKERRQLGGVGCWEGVGGAKRINFNERSTNNRFIIEANS
jgi:hypothetical protein